MGKWQEFYLDGKVRAEGEYKDGLKSGDWIFYFPNGKIEQRG